MNKVTRFFKTQAAVLREQLKWAHKLAKPTLPNGMHSEVPSNVAKGYMVVQTPLGMVFAKHIKTRINDECVYVDLGNHVEQRTVDDCSVQYEVDLITGPDSSTKEFIDASQVVKANI